MTTSNGETKLQALMSIADRYARRLVADAGPSATVLLVECNGDLDVVVLEGEAGDVIAQVRLLLGRSGASSAALLVEASALPSGAAVSGFWIFGESIDGTTARRRYRVRPCGRSRRLTPLRDRDAPELEEQFRPLFPMHVSAEGLEGDVVDAPSTDSPVAPTDANPTAAGPGRIVAA